MKNPVFGPMATAQARQHVYDHLPAHELAKQASRSTYPTLGAFLICDFRSGALAGSNGGAGCELSTASHYA
jgi:hypothetical protein